MVETLLELGGGNYREAKFFSYDHAEEVHREAQELNDSVWDCTLIKIMKEKGASIVNPIYEWLDNDIWDYIHQEQIEVNPLYQKGYTRVGCIGCPMATYHHKKKEFNDYPMYKTMYIKAFDRMLEERKARNKPSEWANGKEVFDWWIEESKYNCIGQYNLFDEDIYG